MPRFPPPSTIADNPVLVRFSANAAGDADRCARAKRASFAPWMKRSDYLWGWDRSTRDKPSKWDLRRHWRKCRRKGYVPKKLTRAERKARYD